MRAADRALRDAQVVGLFLAGTSYRSIARRVGLRSHATVAAIVERSIAAPSSALRRGLLTDEAFAIWQERTEQLFHSHWYRANEGDHKSAEICRKILAEHAKVYGLTSKAVPAPGTQPDAVEVGPDSDEGLNPLEQLRADRARA